MNRVMSICPRCPRLTTGGLCAGCQREDDRRRHAKQRAHGRDTAEWEQLRERRLQLDGWVCTFQLDDGCTLVATTVHLDERLQGRHDLATIADLRSACAHCHGVVDAPRAAASRRRPGPLAESLAEDASPAPRQAPARNVHHAVASGGDK